MLPVKKTNLLQMRLLKTNELVSDDWDSPVIDEVDEDLKTEAEDRAIALASVAPTDTNLVVKTSTSCHKDKHETLSIVGKNEGSDWTIKGTDLGIQTLTHKGVTKNGNVRVQFKQTGIDSFNTTSWYTTPIEDISYWQADKIGISIVEDPGKTKDSLRTFSAKFFVDIPYLKISGPASARDTIVDIKTKTKTVKCIGKFLGKRYGTQDWDLALFHKYGNSVKLPTGFTAFSGNSALTTFPTYGAAINMPSDSANAYVPQAGDIVLRVNGSTVEEGFVYAVGAKDALTGKTKVVIYQRICSTATLKKGTWVYQQGGTFKGKLATQGFVKKTSGQDASLWLNVGKLQA